jgi:TRAP transporter TatT component family protein
LFTAVLMVALGGSAVAMTLDEALGLFVANDISVPFSDEGHATIVEMMDAFLLAVGADDSLDQTNEDAMMAFEIDYSLRGIVSKLAQSYYTLGNIFIPAADNEEVHLKGKHWGLKALRMNPEFDAVEAADGFVAAVAVETDITALYWATSNWLRVAQKHPMQALVAGVPPKTLAMSERALALDPTYMVGGPYRSLGAYYSGLPIGRDLDKSLQYFCHINDAVVCADLEVGDVVPEAEGYYENLTFLAEFYYMETGMWAEAAALLQHVLDSPIGDTYLLYNEYSHVNAANLLEKVNAEL